MDIISVTDSKTWVDDYFTDKKIEELVTRHGWEMVPADRGMYLLQQRDAHHMKTVRFWASNETAERFCGAGSGVLDHDNRRVA